MTPTPRAPGGAAGAIRKDQPASIHNLTDAQLADDLRGQRFARDRADARIVAIGAELDRRGLTTATGTLAVATRHEDPLGRVDLRRLRRERPEVCQAYALEGSGAYWSVRTRTAEERA